MSKTMPLAPGATIGILGSGQLGRMSALEAAPLGYHTHIYAPDENGPGQQVATRSSKGAYDDREALIAFAKACDIVSYEFENIPLETALIVAEHAELRPGAKVLEIAQDRMLEKTFLSDNGVSVAPFAAVSSREDLDAAVDKIGLPAVLKTTRMGYDGKGQAKITSMDDVDAAFAAMKGADAILEGFVNFRMEASILVARGVDGAIMTYPMVENRHVNHILDETIAPARESDALMQQADDLARLIAEKIDLVGLLAVELFITNDDQILVNEMAPRPHNSGHWTQDACTTSQFAQYIRAIAGLPLASIGRHHDAVMKNLIGDDVDTWQDVVKEDNARLHLYGKAEARPGRKMGHVNRLYPLAGED